jgi:hypothetical protein
MVLTPFQFLGLLLMLTAGAGVVRMARRRRHLTQLRELADRWKMHFSVADRFRLAGKIAPRLPLPGAASVRVVDLLYGIEGENYRYVFVTEYTSGVLRTKTGIRRVATFCEPRDPSTLGSPCELQFAPDGLTIFAQYNHLLQKRGDETAKP